MQDGIVVTDDNETVIVNQYSFCELVKWLIVAYVGFFYAEASLCVAKHTDYFASIQTMSQVDFEMHDWPYDYLAMTLYYGDYRQAKPMEAKPDIPAGLARYQIIEETILKQHHLKEPFV